MPREMAPKKAQETKSTEALKEKVENKAKELKKKEDEKLSVFDELNLIDCDTEEKG